MIFYPRACEAVGGVGRAALLQRGMLSLFAGLCIVQAAKRVRRSPAACAAECRDNLLRSYLSYGRSGSTDMGVYLKPGSATCLRIL